MQSSGTPIGPTTLYEYVCYIPMFMDFYKILTLPSVGYSTFLRVSFSCPHRAI